MNRVRVSAQRAQNPPRAAPKAGRTARPQGCPTSAQPVAGHQPVLDGDGGGIIKGAVIKQEFLEMAAEIACGDSVTSGSFDSSSRGISRPALSQHLAAQDGDGRR